MRLLNTQTKVLEQYFGAEVPPFVILSHRWSRPTENELTLQDLKAGIFSKPGVSTSHNAQGFLKVSGACNKAVQDGYDWICIDSCCIDQTSSAELQESINSMWNYYARANICYAYLSDVPGQNTGHESFQNSEWWSRGWTLQELLAPKTVEFYADDWKFLGTRAEMFQEIAGITGIDPNVLKMVKSIDRCTAAEKLSWAAHRQVLREEDESYSLLGLLKVSLPLLYGEGRERAFLRLQDAIYSTKADTTLFLYRYSPFKGQLPLLAYSPASFCSGSSCSKCGTNQTECLHPTFAYDKLQYRVTWDNEAYKSLHASEPLPRQNVTATLQLLKYDGIVASVLNGLDWTGFKVSSRLSIMD